MPVYPNNPNKPLTKMKQRFCYHLELIVGDKLEKRSIIANACFAEGLCYVFYLNGAEISFYPINNTIISDIETIETPQE